MILARKEPPGEEPYWYGRVNGVDKKFRRVIAGIVLPILDRQLGGVVVLGEKFYISGPQDFTVLAAFVGSSKEVEQKILEYNKVYQLGHAIVPTDKERKVLWRIPGLTASSVFTWYAPEWALTEVGRCNVEHLGNDGLLHDCYLIEEVGEGDALDTATNALRVAVNYALDWNPPYITKKARPLEMKPAGTLGL